MREVARRDKDARCIALLHHVTVSGLRAAYGVISPKASPGVDGVRWIGYGGIWGLVVPICMSGCSRGGTGQPRVGVGTSGKADGRGRPWGIASWEDKIVQRVVVEVLGAVYEVDVTGFSYGFGPRCGPHDAWDAFAVGLERKPVNWVFIEHRIADKRIWRLIGKWLAAGVIEEGQWSACEQGSPQGGIGIAAACRRVPALACSTSRISSLIGGRPGRFG